MGIDNDTRGWILSCASGLACILGSGIISIDIIASVCFGKKSFRIADSNTFLSASLSLSAGVMLFTSLYNMLPTSKDYFIRARYSACAAAYILIGLFLLGVIGIQMFSAFVHHHMPSHVVDCTHTHEHEHDSKDIESGNAEAGRPQHSNTWPTTQMPNSVTEHSPLLSQSALIPCPDDLLRSPATHEPARQNLAVPSSSPFRPTMWSRLNGQIAFLLVGKKAYCDKNGPCYGLSQACGQECTKTRLRREASCESETVRGVFRQGHNIGGKVVAGELRTDEDQETVIPVFTVSSSPGGSILDNQAGRQIDDVQREHHHDSNGDHRHSNPPVSGTAPISPETLDDTHQHHHHVPKNAFLSIGLQTSLAIALHKLPEGFITYATNHANPTLGFSVFIALFIHNITEGFAMALPLYLALNSRLKAMFWSCLLGGISQPVGAGIAALWIWGARKVNGQGNDGAPEKDGISWAVYGGLFAATAGVMTSVAMQLFSEGLELTHNRSLCIGFAVAGMGILGLSYALTA